MKSRTYAFTLIELMVVVMILALLMTILIPTIGPMLQMMQKLQTRARIMSLQGGIESYQQQHGVYPGQEDMDLWTGTYTGSQVLAAHLFEYYDDTVGVEDPYAKVLLDNPEPTSKYANYEPDILDAFPDVNGGDDLPNCLTDTFSNPHPIVYYPSGSGQGTSQFSYALNSQLTGIGRSGDFTSFITDDTLKTPNTTGIDVPFKNEMFLLISPGPDGVFFTEDDIKNWN
jgi:prepilin-type N-terminal cleavage/methylation domain-containing protein